MVLFDGSGGAWGTVSGIRGSASVSMAAEVDGGGWRILRRAMMVWAFAGSFVR